VRVKGAIPLEVLTHPPRDFPPVTLRSLDGRRVKVRMLTGNHNLGGPEDLYGHRPWRRIAFDQHIGLFLSDRGLYGVFVIRSHRTYDFVMVFRGPSGSGLCLWNERATVYAYDSKRQILQHIHSFESGGFLGCWDGHSPPCGCGAYESTIEIDTSHRHTRIIVTPELQPRDPDAWGRMTWNVIQNLPTSPPPPKIIHL